jgi:hypothetical protein
MVTLKRRNKKAKRRKKELSENLVNSVNFIESI